MRVNRKFVYAGVFLVAVGGLLVAADLVGVDATAIRDVLQLWPRTIVAIGLGIAFRRMPFGLPAGLVEPLSPASCSAAGSPLRRGSSQIAVSVGRHRS